MAKIKLTRDLAFAASLDVGNRHMKENGRAKWNKADQITASKFFLQLWPPCRHGVNPDECALCSEEG